MNIVGCKHCLPANAAGGLENLSGRRMEPIGLVLALPSVTGIAIHSLYPETGCIACGECAVKLLHYNI